MPDSDSSLSDHLDSLYPLARILVGTEAAEALIQDVYERAASVPPTDRPENTEGWLCRLLLDTRDSPPEPSPPASSTDDRPSSSDDSFRREVAEKTAKRVLPAAFASCSVHQRFILTVDVLGSSSVEVLAEALDCSPAEARSARDEARSALRAAVRDTLNGPERMLVDVALPDTALRDHLQTLVRGRFQPVPPSLKANVETLLHEARTERYSTDASNSDESASPSFVPTPLRAVPVPTSRRAVIGGLLLVLVLAIGVGGGAYLLSSSDPEPAPPSSLIDVVLDRTDKIEQTLQTNNPQTARQHLSETWDQQFSVPEFEAAALQGAGRLHVTDQISVPALQYTDEQSDTPITAVAVNYALLDQLGDQARLDRDLRVRLAENASILTREHPDAAVLLWRERATIFIVTASGLDASELRSRLQV